VKPRRKLLAEMRTRFIAKRYPRVVVLLILGLSGLVAFSFSAWALSLGLDEMGLRYLGATVVGYLTFLLLIRAWIALHRVRQDGSVDLTSLPDLAGLPDGTSPAAGLDAGFGGGHSGGGGASTHWGSPVEAPGGINMDVDADEAWPVVLAAVFLLSGLLAMGYVVYTAPVLLAEVALDAALVTGIYRKLRKEDARHWLHSALRHTWLPATIAAVCLWITGTALQWAMPDARSIGDVVRAIGN
jgi:hypothetical protein